MKSDLKKQEFKGFTFNLVCKCPFCGHIRDGFGYNREMLHCPKCDKDFLEKDLELTIIGAFVCTCGSIIPPIPEYRVCNGYMCTSCKNIIEV